jgi:large conductance mechanosensitive channel
MINGFKQFIMRGNVIELAIGIVIGLAFKAVIDAVVAGLVTPLVAAIFGQPDLTAVGNFAIGQGQFGIGIILQALFDFFAVAAAIYFVVVLPMNKLAERRKLKEEPVVEDGPTEIELLIEIRDALNKQN